jgi:beta-galactosidase
VSLRGTVEIKAIAGPLRDSVTLRVGNVLKPKRLQGPRRTVNPQPTN